MILFGETTKILQHEAQQRIADLTAISLSLKMWTMLNWHALNPVVSHERRHLIKCFGILRFDEEIFKEILANILGLTFLLTDGKQPYVQDCKDTAQVLRRLVGWHSFLFLDFDNSNLINLFPADWDSEVRNPA